MRIYINKNGLQLGPYTLEEAQNLAATGRLSASDWAFYDGLEDWIPLAQVPGFTAPAPPAPVAPAATSATPAAATERAKSSSMAASLPTGTPLLVWVICLFYLIVGSIELVTVAAAPYALSASHASLEKEALQTEVALYRAPDRDTYLKLRQEDRRIRFTEYFVDHNPVQSTGYVFFTEVVTLLSIFGAVYLFQLDRKALYFLWIPAVNSAGQLLYVASVLHRMRFFHLPIFPLALPGFFLTINFLILLYVCTLYRKGVLR